MRDILLAAGACLSLTVSAYAAPASDPHCSNYGPGFVYSATTGFCVKLSGQLSADYTSGSSQSGLGGNSRPTVEGTLDARKDTDLGPFRAVIQPRAGRN